MATVVKKWCVTDALEETIVFDWKIENALTELRLPGGVEDNQSQTSQCRDLGSSEFSSKTNKWNLKIYPTYKDTVAVWIELGYTSAPVWASCKFSIGKNFEYSRDGAWVFKHQYDDPDPEDESDTRKGYVNGFLDFISSNDIKQYVFDDQLTVRCELKIFRGSYDSHIDSESGVVIPECTLKDDMNLLLQDGSNSDVILVTEDRQFKAHRNILSARSPVFARMLENDMKENETGNVEIKDIKAHVLEEMLVFIYTGDCPALEGSTDATIAKDLLYAADKYELLRLKALCEKELMKTIAVSSVAETCIYADMHNAHQLKQACFRFIIARRNEISQTPAWKDIKENQELYHALCQQAFGDTEGEPSAKRARLS